MHWNENELKKLFCTPFFDMQKIIMKLFLNTKESKNVLVKNNHHDFAGLILNVTNIPFHVI